MARQGGQDNGDKSPLILCHTGVRFDHKRVDKGKPASARPYNQIIGIDKHVLATSAGYLIKSLALTIARRHYNEELRAISRASLSGDPTQGSRTDGPEPAAEATPPALEMKSRRSTQITRSSRPK